MWVAHTKSNGDSYSYGHGHSDGYTYGHAHGYADGNSDRDA
jgi:hypothetical protein